MPAPQPSSLGIRSQGMPVRSTYRIPPNAARSESRGRPRDGCGAAASNGSIARHTSSGIAASGESPGAWNRGSLNIVLIPFDLSGLPRTGISKIAAVGEHEGETFFAERCQKVHASRRRPGKVRQSRPCRSAELLRACAIEAPSARAPRYGLFGSPGAGTRGAFGYLHPTQAARYRAVLVWESPLRSGVPVIDGAGSLSREAAQRSSPRQLTRTSGRASWKRVAASREKAVR